MNTEMDNLGGKWHMLFAAWMLSLISTLAVLFIGEVMGQAPCVLCWYQRAFMFPLAVMLAIAAWRNDFSVWRYALPLAVIGWLIAAFHSLLYFGIIPAPIQPCGAGPSCSGSDMMVMGVIAIPLLSLAAFTLIGGLLIALRERKVS